MLGLKCIQYHKSKTMMDLWMHMKILLKTPVVNGKLAVVDSCSLESSTQKVEWFEVDTVPG